MPRKLTLIVLTLAFLLFGGVLAHAVPDGRGNELFPKENVGIGTMTPIGGLVVMNGNVGIGTWVPGSALEIEGGNIGIGSTAPGAALDVQGAIRSTSLVMPSGSAPTVDAAGKVAVDTTADDFVYYGSTKRVLTYKNFKSYTIESPVNGDSILIFKAPFAITVTNIECIVDPGASSKSAVLTLKDKGSDGTGSTAINNALTCSNTGASDSSPTSPSVASGDWVSMDVGTVTGAVSQLAVTVTYTKNAE